MEIRSEDRQSTITLTIADKETEHYPVWRDAVAAMMADPRHSVKFNNLFPDDKIW